MKEVPQEFADDPGAAAYFQASLYANLKADKQLEYDRIMDTKYDIEDSLLDAELKGEARKQREIAKAMKADGVDVKIIVKYTGLSEGQITAL